MQGGSARKRLSHHRLLVLDECSWILSITGEILQTQYIDCTKGNSVLNNKTPTF